MPPLALTRTPNTLQPGRGAKRDAAAGSARSSVVSSQIGIEVDEGSSGGGGHLAADLWPGEEEEEESEVSSALAMQQFAQMQKRKRKGK